MAVTVRGLAIAAGDGVAGGLGLLDRPFAPDSLIAIAGRRTGLSSFGATPVRDALAHFLEACRSEAALGVVGRFTTRWDVLRFLANVQRMAEAERQDPTIREEVISPPLVITGLPRSGTTFLHHLMLCDPANRAPLVWETIYPFPECTRPGAADRRRDTVARQLKAFQWLAPEFRGLHTITADSPQECSEITAHSFRSLRFDSTYRIPSYRAWLEADAERHLEAYRLHKRFLQHLQHQAGPPARRWVLKCPDHLFALAALRRVYPGVRLVFVHRDPLKVLLSVAKLTEVLRRAFSRRVDRQEIGRVESARWLEGADRMVQASASNEHENGPAICHIHYLDLIADPLATVGMVYRHFGMELPEAAADAVVRFTAARPTGGYPPHRYRFEDHGLDAAREREKFRPYMDTFGLAPETESGRQEALRKVRLIRSRPVAGCSPSASGSIP